MNQKFKQNNGITLIALVITIIVLLILAGVTMSMVLGDDGIIAQAQKAKVAQENSDEEEQFAIADYEVDIITRDPSQITNSKFYTVENGELNVNGSRETGYSSEIPANFVIPNGITKIADSAFDNCSIIETVTIPNTITEIGEYAFNGCTKLKKINIPSSVTHIPMNAFCGCSVLENIKLRNGITSIGAYAFMQCYKLTEIKIPNSVTSIGDRAFFMCTGLKKVTIPSSVTNFGTAPFSNISSDCKFVVGSETVKTTLISNNSIIEANITVDPSIN